MADPLGRLTAALVDRYRLDRELGRGGMATVYLAHDLKHERRVAIKVLHEDLGATLGPERFLAEIKTTAKLQHPHILTLLDSGEAAGLLYYAMPYVAGESLRARLERAGALPLEEVLVIVRGAAAALDFAHRQGIVHRDIKPENVLLHEGVPMVADFGIALAVASAGGARLTETGISLGTPAYMSPEQVTGERTLDGRCDQYSLACVLYELVSGAPPFTAPTAQGLYVKHVTERAPELRARAGDLSDAICRAVARALAKDPAERFGTCAEFAAALVAGRAGAEVTEVRSTVARSPQLRADTSVLVLPFVNANGTSDEDFFSDGLTEELITDLSRLEGVRVVSSAVSFRLKGSDKPVPAIAAELNASYVVLGRVRRSGDAVRITAQLLDAASEASLWADRFTGTPNELFEFQERVSSAIAGALRLKISDRRRIADPVVSDLLRRARHYLREYGEDYHRRALSSCEEALERDPGCAQALALKARILVDIATGMFSGQVGDYMSRARTAAQLAIGIDRELADAHLALALVATYHEWDFRAAERSFLEALRVDPGLTAARVWYVGNLVWLDTRQEEARDQLRLALETDPLDPMSHVFRTWVAVWSRNPADAVAAARQAVTLFPKWGLASYALGHALRCAGSFAEAVSSYERAIALDGPGLMFSALLGAAYAAAGRREDSLQMLSELERRDRSGETADVLMMYVCTALGDIDRAAEHLDRAVARRAPGLVFVPRDPLVDPLRTHPRFRAMLHAMGLDHLAEATPAAVVSPAPAPPSSPADKSIVVLPFENLSPDPNNAFFADGLTEELIADLSKVRALRVISRTSAMQFRGATKGVPAIARELNVRYVLEGSVRRAGNSLRVTAQLIDAATDAHLWAEKYGGTLEDVFDLQERLSRRIVEGLKLSLAPEEDRHLAERPIGDVRAYDAYLRALAAIGRGTESGMREAIRDLEMARGVIGDKALLCCGVSYAHWFLANIGISMEENLARCEEWARKALALDPRSARGRALLGMAGLNYRNTKPSPAVIGDFKQALRDDPNEPLALLGSFFVHLFAGRIEEASAFGGRYIDRDPLDIWAFALPIYVAWFGGDFERGLEAARRAAAVGHPGDAVHMPWALAWAGKREEAIAAAERAAAAAPNQVHAKLGRMVAHGIRRDVAGARAELTPEFREWCYRETSWSYFVAAAFALAGGEDDALNWLEHAVDLGWINYPFMAAQDPFLAGFRGGARFERLMVRVKREWQEFEA